LAQRQLQQQGGEWISEPIPLDRRGNISSIESISPSGTWQYRLGRDVVWFGNFENEGCALWSFGSGTLDSTTVHAGRRSLLQRRNAGSGSITSAFEKRMLCDSASLKYSLYGYVKTENANNATMRVSFHASRSGWEIGSSDLGGGISGTSDWMFHHREFTPSIGTTFFDLQLASAAPASGTGSVWFDDVGIIQWSAWKSFDPAEVIVTPNDYYWLQVKTTLAIDQVSISYRTTAYGQSTTSVGTGPGNQPNGCVLLQNYPNPANPGTMIRYTIPSGKPYVVSLKVFDVLGRQVATLVNEEKESGTHHVWWDARACASGVYFYKLQVGAFVDVRKLIVLK
jgi:hypothetical protein